MVVAEFGTSVAIAVSHVSNRRLRFVAETS